MEKVCVGIKKETGHVDERRVVLTPDHVKKLIKEHDIAVIVQPSKLRIFKDAEYRAAGATISSNLESCKVILGVKEVPAKELMADKTYLFFSHTIKGQKYNMGMLKQILKKKITLIDYELVKRDNGRRVVFFGDYAGYVGMINALWTFGKRLKWEGVENPFEELQQTCTYDSLAEIKKVIKNIGKKIKKEGLPNQLAPLVVGFTGFGRVSKASQEIIRLLPSINIPADELGEFYRKGKFSNGVIYIVEFKKSDMLMKKEGGNFDSYLYRKYPDQFTSKFEKFIPYLSIIVNGIYWEPQFPRLVTLSYMKQFYEFNPNPKLRVIADISCDISGSIELTTKSTTSENPVYVYEPLTDKVTDGVEGFGPVILAQDKLPIELPKESSQSFGNALLQYIPQLARADYSKERLELNIPKVFKKAVIAHQGELAKRYHHLHAYIDKKERKK
ncbi:MAG: hypothetical protein KKF65_04745 [Nanoarchaeota archaeon]|nr:hypothetical protein [Nanoarchaeota archaeon]